MIHKLDESSYEKVRPLFRPLEEHQPMCTAVLEGIYPGSVYTDDPASPQTALLYTFLSTGGVAWCFLAGNADNAAFNQAVNEALFDQKIAGEVPALFFTCHPQDWQGQLPVVGHPRQPAPMPRRHYVCRQLQYDWTAHVPEGFTVQRMDEALLNRPGLTVPNEIQATLAYWRSISDPRFQDFGFVTIHGDVAAPTAEIASWATVDFCVNAGDIGFFTMEAYRQRGLATVVAAAAIDHGLSQGLSMVSWTCAESNIGSIRIAERLGLERQRDYRMYCFALDQASHLAQLAYAKLEEGHYQQVIDLYEQFFALQDEHPSWAHFDVAQAWAALGDRDKALEHLNAAADRGWTHLDGVTSCKEFETLHGMPEWATVLERIRQNKGGR